jgi:hypothetical protein
MTDEPGNVVPFSKYRGQPVEAMLADRAQYRSEPRVTATMKAACRACNSVCFPATDMTWALVDPRPGRPDETSDQVRILGGHVERFARALERDPSLRGRRGVSDLEAPDLRLADMVAEVRSAYAREHGLKAVAS